MKAAMLTTAQTDNYFDFYNKWKGYEFRQLGRVTAKHEVWHKHGNRESYDLHYTVTEKPGWDDGKLKYKAMYERYLNTLNYDGGKQ